MHIALDAYDYKQSTKSMQTGEHGLYPWGGHRYIPEKEHRMTQHPQSLDQLNVIKQHFSEAKQQNMSAW